MTACIVGWAHTKFGRLEGETLESLIVRVTGEALADAGIGPADVDEIVLGHFNAGFSPQDFTASLVLQAAPELALQARHAGRECLRDRLGGRAPGPQEHRGEVGAHRAGGRRRADDHDARRRDRPQSAQGVVCARGSRHRGRLRGHLRQDRRPVLPALGRPVGRARPDRRQEPQERRRQSVRADPQGPGLRVLPHRKREEPARRRAAQAHRLLARLRRRRRAGADRRRDRAAAAQGGGVPRRRARAGFPADVEARRAEVRGLRRGLAARARAVPGWRCPTCRSSKPTTASPSPN